jgi:hypothetical protein
LNPVGISQYHDWKRSRGVSQEEIDAKEQAVKDIMFIQDPAWYLRTLGWIGFKDIQVIDASWCFTSFMAVK